MLIPRRVVVHSWPNLSPVLQLNSTVPRLGKHELLFLEYSWKNLFLQVFGVVWQVWFVCKSVGGACDLGLCLWGLKYVFRWGLEGWFWDQSFPYLFFSLVFSILYILNFFFFFLTFKPSLFPVTLFCGMVTTRELESPLPVCCGTLYNLHIMLLLGLLCVFNFFFLGLEEAEIR